MTAGGIVLVLTLLVVSGVPIAAGSTPGHPAPSAGSHPIAAATEAATALAAATRSLSQGSGPTHGSPWTCRGDPNWGDGACRMDRYALAPKGATGGNGWVPQANVPPPQSEYNFRMTYDVADGYVLMLGSPAGPYGAPTGTDAWSYSQGVWRSLAGTNPPPNCPGSSLAYDEWDGYVVYFGAEASPYASSCPSANETWSYRGGLWTQLHPTQSPTGRWGASFTNDSGDGYLLLFGGANYTLRYNYSYVGYLNDSWSFRAGNWSKLSPTTAPPSPRSDAGLAYDPIDGYTVLFGGSTWYNYVNDTWTYVGGVWTQLHPTTAPPVPYVDGFTYDPVDQVVVYTNAFFPAYNYSKQPEQTWTFTGGNWTQIHLATGPLQRQGAEQAWDYSGQYLVLFGGLSQTYLSDTWTYSAGAWTNRSTFAPGLLFAPAMAYDGADQYVLLFGGIGAGSDSWTYALGNWTRLNLSSAPSSRYGEGMAYDAHDGYVLLFGGISGSTGLPLNDSWEFAGGAWTPLTPSRAPSPRFTYGLVYDGADGYVLLFGGTVAPSFPFSNNTAGAGMQDTWSFQAGVWTNQTSTTHGAPPSGALNPMVYDAADGYVLLFGTFLSTAPGFGWTDAQPETWSYLGGVWTNRTNALLPTPPARSAAAFAYDSAESAAILFGGVSTNSNALMYADTWSFSGGSWQELLPEISPNNQSAAGSADDPGDSALILLGAYAGAGPGCQSSACGDAWLWTGGGVRPVIRSFTASPAVVDVGNRTSLSVAASEGGAALSYTYSGLPPGCLSQNVSILTCVPSAVGSYDNITVNVTDPAGASSLAQLTLLVVPLPQIASATAAPWLIVLGSRTILTINVSGGTAPFTFAYYGLPPGCASQTVPALPCTPTASGNYSVLVRVSDAFDRNASASVNFSVSPAGGGANPSVSAFAANPSALVLGNSTNFTVNASGGIGSLSYTYTGLPPGCLTSNVSMLPCGPTASGTFTVTVSVIDAFGNSTAVATRLTVYPVGGGRGLVLLAFQPTAPGATVGSSIGLRVLASGGVGPLTYEYTGLPSGCSSSNLSLLTCVPNASGVYRVHVLVSDAAGDSVGAPLVLVVVESSNASGPAITAFLPVPSTILLGGSTVLTVTVTGGSPVRSFTYDGLPDGCVSANTPTLPCTPQRFGTFHVGIRVVDGNGQSANATTLLTVNPSAIVPPPLGPPPVGPLLFVASAGVLVALVGILAFLLGRRRPPVPMSP